MGGGIGREEALDQGRRIRRGAHLTRDGEGRAQAATGEPGQQEDAEAVEVVRRAGIAQGAPHERAARGAS